MGVGGGGGGGNTAVKPSRPVLRRGENKKKLSRLKSSSFYKSNSTFLRAVSQTPFVFVLTPSVVPPCCPVVLCSPTVISPVDLTSFPGQPEH